MGEAMVEEMKCSTCEKTFACKRYLVKHMARVHSRDKEDKKPLECAICGKDFPRLSHLQRHQLIHIKEREWGCPFCERSFVQKPHLIRHIGRCHASEEGGNLEERIAANKWRSDNTPVQPVSNTSNTTAKSFPSPHLCSDLVPTLLCIQCGATFSTRTDLDRHSTNTHRPIKCGHCGEIFDGYTNLKAHEMQQRDHAHACSCGASFARAAELRTHRDSCRKRGSFLCLTCDEVFTQRVQLDRHWNKKHFNSQCSDCGWIAAAPMRLYEHVWEQHGKRICGYCGVQNPAVDHVTAEHWKRLSRSVALRSSGAEQLAVTGNKTERSVSSSCEAKSEVSSDDESAVDTSTEVDHLSATTCDNSSAASTSSSDAEATNTADEAQEVDCVKLQSAQAQSCTPATSTSNTHEECYLNVVVSVPDDVVDEFYFGNRLPREILRLFPEFVNARLCLVEPFIGESRFLSLHIPVARPPEGDTEAARLLSVPIFV